MGAFGNSNFTNVYSDAEASRQAAQQASQGTQASQSQAQSPNQQPTAQSQTQAVAPQQSEAPGSDLIDGFASILFAPGRAIVAQFHQPTMKDLPIIIGLSAVVYWGLYKFVWPQIESVFMPSSSSDSGRRRNPRKKRVIETIEEEGDD